MALTVTDLGVGLRIIADSTETLDPATEALLTRLLGSASALVGVYASPGTPVAVVEQSTILVASYLWDQPAAARGAGFATAWISSGASAIVEPWRVRRAGVLAGEVPGDGSSSVRTGSVGRSGLDCRLGRNREPGADPGGQAVGGPKRLRFAGGVGVGARRSAGCNQRNNQCRDINGGVWLGSLACSPPGASHRARLGEGYQHAYPWVKAGECSNGRRRRCYFRRQAPGAAGGSPARLEPDSGRGRGIFQSGQITIPLTVRPLGTTEGLLDASLPSWTRFGSVPLPANQEGDLYHWGAYPFGLWAG